MKKPKRANEGNRPPEWLLNVGRFYLKEANDYAEKSIEAYKQFEKEKNYKKMTIHFNSLNHHYELMNGALKQFQIISSVIYPVWSEGVEAWIHNNYCPNKRKPITCKNLLWKDLTWIIIDLPEMDIPEISEARKELQILIEQLDKINIV